MAGSPTPPLIQEAFGSGAASSYITNPIPVASQISVKAGAASYTDGFPPLTMMPASAGGVKPFGQDMNGILYAATANIAALTGGQQYQFSSTYASANGGYALGAILAMASGAGYWINQVSGNSNNPDTTAPASSGWAPLSVYGATTLSGLASSNVTLTGPQAAAPQIFLSGALTANIQIIFPAWVRGWTVTNSTTGAYTVTCTTASGTGVAITQGATVQIFGNGTNIVAGATLIPNGYIQSQMIAPGAVSSATQYTAASTSLPDTGLNQTMISVSLSGTVTMLLLGRVHFACTEAQLITTASLYNNSGSTLLDTSSLDLVSPSASEFIADINLQGIISASGGANQSITLVASSSGTVGSVTASAQLTVIRLSA
jgi:hypothetical protein